MYRVNSFYEIHKYKKKHVEMFITIRKSKTKSRKIIYYDFSLRLLSYIVLNRRICTLASSILLQDLSIVFHKIYI